MIAARSTNYRYDGCRVIYEAIGFSVIYEAIGFSVGLVELVLVWV